MSKVEKKEMLIIATWYMNLIKNIWNFLFDRFLYKYTTLLNGYTKCPRKFTKSLPHTFLSELRKVEKIVVSGYFDDLITINSSYASYHRNIAKTIKLFISLVLVIQSPSSYLLKKLNTQDSRRESEESECYRS